MSFPEVIRLRSQAWLQFKVVFRSGRIGICLSVGGHFVARLSTMSESRLKYIDQTVSAAVNNAD